MFCGIAFWAHTIAFQGLKLLFADNTNCLHSRCVWFASLMNCFPDRILSFVGPEAEDIVMVYVLLSSFNIWICFEDAWYILFLLHYFFHYISYVEDFYSFSYE